MKRKPKRERAAPLVIDTVAAVPEPKEPTRIAVLGSAPSSRLLAPFADPKWQIWACSPANTGALSRVDIWFEVHAVNICKAPEYWPQLKAHFDWLNAQSCRVMMETAPNDIIPRAEQFPYQDLLRKYGPHQFTSSIAWMLAYAIDQLEDEARAAKENGTEPPVIGIFGVDMAANGEWENQRGGCHHFMWLAEDRGIQVRIPFESDLHRPPPLYGIGEGSPMARKIDLHRRELVERMQQENAQFQAHRDQALMIQGAVAELDYVSRTWMVPPG